MKKIYLLFLFLLSFFFINSQTITNGSFESTDGITGWTIFNNSDNNSVLSHDLTQGNESIGALKLTASTSGFGAQQTITAANSTFTSSDTQYRFQMKVKGTAGTKIRGAIIYTDPNNVIAGNTFMPELTLTGGWDNYLKELTLKSSYDGTGLKIVIQGRTASSTYYIDDVLFTGRNNNTWNSSTSQDWNTASNWSLGTVPTNHTAVIVGGSGDNGFPIISNSGAKAGSIVIYSGNYLTLSAEADLTVSGNIQSKGFFRINSSNDQSGSLIALGYSSNGLTATGVAGAEDGIIYKKWINEEGSPGWDLTGSPVIGQTFSGITSSLAQSSSYYGVGPYDNATDTFDTYTSSEASTAGTIVTGTGFQMSTPATIAANGSLVNFTGYANMHNVSVAITENDGVGSGTQWNLIANPFTSYICLNSAANSASSAATIDFLTYNASTSDVLGFSAGEDVVYYWDGDSYETYSNSDTAKYIAPGQGFFVSSQNATGSSVVFATSMQTHATSDDFIAGDAMDPDRAELFISLAQNDLERQTKLFFLENMTDDLDPTYDGAVFGLQDNPIYTRLVAGDNGMDLSTQALLFSEINDKVIPLGINAEAGEEATISISHNTTNPSTYVYLEDAFEGTFTNLKETDFVTTPDSDLQGVGRFFIHTSSTTMSNDDVSTNLLNVFKLSNNNFITVEGLATESNQTNLKLYNLLGKEVLSTTLLNNTNTQTISTEGLSAGIYVIKLESGNNLLTKKLIIK